MPLGNYDFIVVGAGPSGSSLASRLANIKARPSVLLLEAGGENDDPTYRIASERHHFWAGDGLKLDYGYKTVPQAALNGRTLHYHRGKGLGGSTATNLGLWDYGSKPEYDEWARQVGDDEWNWSNVVSRMKKIEKYHDSTPAKYQKYVRPRSEVHGTNGPVDVQLPAVWDKSLPLILEALEANGLPLNPDINSDQCIGFGIPPVTTHNGLRVTAATAYLAQKSSNLDILVNSRVNRILFDGVKAIGVEISGEGQKYYASKEIVICAGSIDTPKLLLHSGVGPAQDLAKYSIPMVFNQPAIGENLRDHPMVRIAAKVKPEVISKRETYSPQADEKSQLPKDKSEPLEDDVGGTCQGYCTLDVASYPEFKDLTIEIQKHLSNLKTPAYELITRITPTQNGDDLLWSATVIMMNSMSTGRVFLQSKDVDDGLAIDLNFLSNPYDVRVTIDAVRRTVDLLCNSTVIATDGLVLGPRSHEDSDILEFVRSNLGHLWHAVGTVKMGKEGESQTCVTPDFRVVGLSGLRVADLSVSPLIPCNHTQSTAYLVGELAADKIIGEYRLDQ